MIDIRDISPDLTPPTMCEAEPAPGRRVRQVTPGYEGTEVYHALYLPPGWQPGRLHPVIVEWTGNGPYRNTYGDVCTGRVEDSKLGYGISGGEKVVASFTFVETGFRNHDDAWILRPSAARTQLRKWLAQVLNASPLSIAPLDRHCSQKRFENGSGSAGAAST